MKRKQAAAIIGAVVVIVVLVFLARPIPVVENPYVRATTRNSAGYFTLRNYGLVGYCITGVEIIEPKVMAMMHKTIKTEEGMHKMVEVDKVCVGPFGSFEFKQGGYHVMIMDPLNDVKKIRLRLLLEDGSSIEFTAKVTRGV